MATFVLEHRQTGDTQILGGWGYVCGGLLGPIYLLIKGFPGLALVMIPISVLVFTIGGTVMVLVALASWPTEITTVVGIFLIVVMFAVHGYLAVQMLRAGYIRRGYREGYY